MIEKRTSSSTTNPFQDTSAVRSPDMFFGRTPLLRRILSAIIHRQCISVVGARRAGKSSLLKIMTSREIGQLVGLDLSNYLFVWLSISDHLLQQTCEAFFDALNTQIISEYKKQGGNSLLVNGIGSEGFRALLYQLADYGIHPVILMDGFDNVTRNEVFGPDFLSFLRAQANAGRVSYITASIAPLIEVCHEAIIGSTFFELFTEERLEVLTNEEAHALITVPAAKARHPFTGAEVDWVISLVGRHPYFIQRVCYFLFEEKTTYNDEIDLDKVKEQVYKALLPTFIDMWNHFSKEQQEYLKGNVQHVDEKKKELDALHESFLLRAFVQTKHEVEATSITKDMVKEALKHVKQGNLTQLGECELQALPVVTTRLLHMSSPSAIDKGKVIKEVLQEALKSLQGLGSHSDTQKDWISYNILYYYYFKDLTHEVVSGRIGIYENTYFRRLKKAREELHNALLTMKPE